jgi:hypothetical protein
MQQKNLFVQFTMRMKIYSNEKVLQCKAHFNEDEEDLWWLKEKIRRNFPKIPNMLQNAQLVSLF